MSSVHHVGRTSCRQNIVRSIGPPTMKPQTTTPAAQQAGTSLRARLAAEEPEQQGRQHENDEGRRRKDEYDQKPIALFAEPLIVERNARTVKAQAAVASSVTVLTIAANTEVPSVPCSAGRWISVMVGLRFMQQVGDKPLTDRFDFLRAFPIA
jgi:hypothetical protein